MPDLEQTPRQRIKEMLTDQALSAREIANLVNLPERQVEEHLSHIVKTVGHDHTKRFLMIPPECLECGFIFRDRKRMTCPSRCPQCHNEGILPPRFGISGRTFK